MARETPQPSDAEWKVLNGLWGRNPVNARELLELLGAEGWAYTTLKTMLARMETKGFVEVEMRGNTGWYRPVIEQRAMQRNALRTLIERVFEGAAGPLLAHLADEKSLTPAERKKVEAWAAELERAPRPGKKGPRRGRG